MKFIELTSKVTGEKFAINVSNIVRIDREDDGCFITMLNTKKCRYGPRVKESYDTVLALIRTKQRLL